MEHSKEYTTTTKYHNPFKKSTNLMFTIIASYNLIRLFNLIKKIKWIFIQSLMR